jgi:Domain of unknown function (DUF3332)
MKLKMAVTSLAVSAALLTTGCYGQFALTRKLYTWNGQVTGNKFANSAVMFVLFVVPVYELLGLGDWLILNTIEVLTGTNPAAQLEIQHGGHTWALAAIDANRAELRRDGARVAVLARRPE